MCSGKQSTYTRRDREKGKHKVENQQTHKEREKGTQRVDNQLTQRGRKRERIRLKVTVK